MHAKLRAPRWVSNPMLWATLARGLPRALAGNAQRLAAVAMMLVFANVGAALAQEIPPNACGNTTWTLTAGQTIPVGTLTVANDVDNIYVEYAIDTDNYDAEFGTLHLWIGNDLTNVPSNPQGIPVPGQFPYSHDASGLTSYTFVIPFTDVGIVDIPQACPLQLFVAAHAEVTLTDENGEPEAETAWGGDQPGPGPRWWFYAEYNICCDPEEPPVIDVCETAFAKGGWVWTTMRQSNPEELPSLRLIRNRWGWAIELLAPTPEGGTTYEIWAGAGLNDTSNGTLVGTLTIDWDGTVINVEYDLDSGYFMKEVHIYVGQDEPTTTAPGRYGYTDYFDPPSGYHGASFALSDDGDGVWVIAHAVVCSVTQ